MVRQSIAQFPLYLVFNTTISIGVAYAASGMTNQVTSSPRPIRFVVPYAAGGGSDIVARVIGAKMTDVLGRQVVIDNRPGAGITIGSDLVAKAVPDGSSILLVTIAHAVNPSLYTDLPYDSEREFAPVTLVTTTPLVLVVYPGVAARSVNELIALAKSKPGQLNYASFGNGSPAHLSGELLKGMASIDISHIPYKGALPAATDLVGGQVQISFLPPSVASQFVATGRMRALAVTTAQRFKALPELPTVSEAGLPGYELVSWQGVLTTGGTPKDVVNKLNETIVAITNTSEVSKSLVAQGYEVTVDTPEHFRSYIRMEMQRFSKLVKRIGARAD